MASTEPEIRALLDDRSAAIRAKDLDRLLSFYAPDVVYFDIVPPLQYVGSAALRGRFQHWFGTYEGPIGQEVHDLTVLGDGDLAVASMLIRSGGTLATGQDVALWVRATSSCRRSDGRWAIAHEHVSLPVDLASGGRAVTDLAP
jgi:uncharacterized protein (TIGR02246 family)